MSKSMAGHDSLPDGGRKNPPHAIVSIGLNGLITSFSASAEKMLGYKAEELVDKASALILHDLEEVKLYSEKFSKELNIKIEPGLDTFVCHTNLGLENNFEWTYVHKNGRRMLAFLTINAVYDGAGNKTGYQGIAQDITALKVVERKLRKSNEELAQFAYRTSHDLKAPLVTIVGLAGCIEEDLETGDIEEVKQNIKRIKKHALKLENLVVDILDIAKADLQEEPFESFCINDLLLDIIKKCEIESTERQVEISVQVEGCTTVYSQSKRLKSILENLILNGIRYSDTSKNNMFVRIYCKVGAGVQITVSDNGVGIPTDQQKNVFQMFSRFRPDLAEGTGLGMAIVEKRVESLGGDISFTSSEAGSEFKINLPKKG